uniref:RNA helicase n=1 Tax=Macrobrachium nipponense TaxID=159736 RepID=K4EF72_MACNP|nr:vasa-like protein [Macrobrachium nipponense]
MSDWEDSDDLGSCQQHELIQSTANKTNWEFGSMGTEDELPENTHLEDDGMSSRGRGRGRGRSRGFGRGQGRGRGGQSGSCFKCGKEGHLSRDCSDDSQIKENQEGQPRNPLYIPSDIEDSEIACMRIEAGINFDSCGNIPVNVSGDGIIPSRVNSFEEMTIQNILLENIQKAKYNKPTPIQSAAVPILISGRDIMGCAQTGSGKTVAYLLPILNYICKENCSSHSMEETSKPTGLVLCPTRELALQIYFEARKLSFGSTLLNKVVYGGTAVFHQLKQIQDGCHLLVGTIGRVVDFMNRGNLLFDDLKFIVLDEADKMLSMGFLTDLKKIFHHSSMPPPDQRQTLMFSATFPSEVQSLATNFMNNYVFVVVGTVGAANTDVSQEIVEVNKGKKKDILYEHIGELLSAEDGMKILVFVETKKMADFIGAFLCNNQISATTIHGDRHQQQREEALKTFRNGKFDVLVATAVAARGLDIPGIGCVINFDLPKEVDEYVHRIGRTGRVGNCGRAISFFDRGVDSHLSKDLVKILAEANQVVPEWLKAAADESGYAQGYSGSGTYASTDIRKKRSIQTESNWEGSSVGGPAAFRSTIAVDEDDDWDA